jgi:hypothetical protein
LTNIISEEWAMTEGVKFVENAANGFDCFQVGFFVRLADAVGFTRLPLGEDAPACSAMIAGINPVPHVFPVSADGRP